MLTILADRLIAARKAIRVDSKLVAAGASKLDRNFVMAKRPRDHIQQSLERAEDKINTWRDPTRSLTEQNSRPWLTRRIRIESRERAISW